MGASLGVLRTGLCPAALRSAASRLPPRAQALGPSSEDPPGDHRLGGPESSRSPIVDVVPDARRGLVLARPGRMNVEAVIKDGAPRRVRRRRSQELGGQSPGQRPALALFGLVLLAVAPVGELARRLLPALGDDAADRRGELRALPAVQDDPSHREHSRPALVPRFPVHRQGQTVRVVLAAPGHADQEHRNEQGRREPRHASRSHSQHRREPSGHGRGVTVNSRRAFSRLSAPPPNAGPGLSSAPPFELRPSVEPGSGAGRSNRPAGPAPPARRPSAPRAGGRGASLATAPGRAWRRAGAGPPARPGRRGGGSLPMWSPSLGAAGQPPRGAPWTTRWRWPAWLTGRRACPP